MEERSPADEFNTILTGKSTDTNASSGRTATDRGTTDGGTTDGGAGESIQRLKNYPACVKYENDKIVEVYLTSTLISKVVYKGEPRSICPKKLYHNYLIADVGTFSTDPMMYGTFFEERCIGRGRMGNQNIQLPKLKDGKPSINEVRILEQVEMFKVVAEHYGIIIRDDNVQVHNRIPLEVKSHPDIKAFIDGTADILSPITVPKTVYNFDVAVIDLKLTRDRNQEHGEFAWGTPQYLDVTQLVHYSELFNLPSFYLVFDYNAKSNTRKHTANGHKLLPVMTMPMAKALGYTEDYDHPDHIKARNRRRDWLNALKTTFTEIMKMDTDGYPTKPSYDECSTCALNPMVSPVGTCKMANAIQNI